MARALNDDAGLIADVQRALGAPTARPDSIAHQADPRAIALLRQRRAEQAAAERAARETAELAELHRAANEARAYADQLRAEADAATDPLAALSGWRNRLRAAIDAALQAPTSTCTTTSQETN